MNKYRIIVCALAFVAGVVAFILDRFGLLQYFGFTFRVSYDSLHWGSIGMLAACLGISGVVYLGFDFLFRYIEKRIAKEKER